MKAMNFPDVLKNIVYSAENPQPQSLFSEGQLKVITIGLEVGQKIPVHPEGTAIYIFLKGKGWMTVDGERLSVRSGTTIFTQAGAQRGIEAKTRLSVILVRISTPPDSVSNPAINNRKRNPTNFEGYES